ncbi:hypothetical protein RvY_04678 [Ramazzottius varieornatus]|uniref:Uncharacterized protein n=1 Tax=Ramazzottius varieornatus TaxID=947166 RepID=A0A1D1V1M3_RAMVA|nr:hypothetical protein RvY_04678 [Ramazzottius varieornatus]
MGLHGHGFQGRWIYNMNYPKYYKTGANQGQSAREEDDWEDTEDDGQDGEGDEDDDLEDTPKFFAPKCRLADSASGSAGARHLDFREGMGEDILGNRTRKFDIDLGNQTEKNSADIVDAHFPPVSEEDLAKISERPKGIVEQHHRGKIALIGRLEGQVNTLIICVPEMRVLRI